MATHSVQRLLWKACLQSATWMSHAGEIVVKWPSCVSTLDVWTTLKAIASSCKGIRTIYGWLLGPPCIPASNCFSWMPHDKETCPTTCGRYQIPIMKKGFSDKTSSDKYHGLRLRYCTVGGWKCVYPQHFWSRENEAEMLMGSQLKKNLKLL